MPPSSRRGVIRRGKLFRPATSGPAVPSCLAARRGSSVAAAALFACPVVDDRQRRSRSTTHSAASGDSRAAAAYISKHAGETQPTWSPWHEWHFEVRLPKCGRTHSRDGRRSSRLYEVICYDGQACNAKHPADIPRRAGKKGGQFDYALATSVSSATHARTHTRGHATASIIRAMAGGRSGIPLSDPAASCSPAARVLRSPALPLPLQTLL